MTRPKYVASCSGGKDSVATLLLAAQHNEPLDEAVFSEVMFDKNTSGEVPEHRDFIYDRLKPFCEKELGIKFTIDNDFPLPCVCQKTPPLPSVTVACFVDSIAFLTAKY